MDRITYFRDTIFDYALARSARRVLIGLAALALLPLAACELPVDEAAVSDAGADNGIVEIQAFDGQTPGDGQSGQTSNDEESLALLVPSFYHLGGGGCRTPNGGSGTYSTYHDVSWGQCQSHCKNHGSCKAIEYTIRHDGSSGCEVHTSPIDHSSGYAYNPQTTVSCWGYTP